MFESFEDVAKAYPNIVGSLFEFQGLYDDDYPDLFKVVEGTADREKLRYFNRKFEIDKMMMKPSSLAVFVLEDGRCLVGTPRIYSHIQ